MKAGSFSRIFRDDRGVTAPIVAVLGAVILGASGVALDTGLYFSQNSNLQSVTESAALSAAAAPNIADAETRARSFFVRNGYPASAVTSVTLGRYCADKDMASTARFVTNFAACPGNGLRTAVRVHATAQSKSYLTSALGGGSLIPQLASTATAARIDEAGLEINTGALALNPGLVNSLLSLLVGHNIALSNAQYQLLLASNIDAGLMFDALAVRVGETGSYANLVSRTVSVADLVSACGTAAATDNPPLSTALMALAAQIGGGAQVSLAGLFDLGVWEKMPVGYSNEKPGLRAGLNSYQLITYALQSGGRTANLSGLSIGVTGVAAIRLAGLVNTNPSRARFAFGPQGETSVGTAA
ncbi:MAG: hypothetical protein JWO15_3075, partial [Sphingomonadales bacterium]|nr:hypothetical protein [Sphingomonadales bacterium]